MQIFTQLDQIFYVVWGLRFRGTLSVSTFMKSILSKLVLTTTLFLGANRHEVARTLIFPRGIVSPTER